MEFREYKIENIFTVSGSKCVKKDIAEAGNGYKDKTPYICRGTSNNGCEGFFNFTPSQKKNCITVGSQGATAFYQFLDFFTGTGVIILRSEKLNENNAIYIMTILNKKLESFGYGYEVTQEKLKNIELSIPSIIHNDGTFEPDWDYMENYIKELKEKVNIYSQTEMNVIDNVKKHRNEKIDVSDWKEYKMNEIFDISGLKSVKSISNISPERTKKFNIALIGEGDDNNQIKGYIESDIFDEKNIITCNRFTGRCFYQEINSVISRTSSAKIKIKNRSLNKNLALFLISVFNLNISNYSRSDKRCTKDLLSESLKLPSIIHPDGTFEPDWDYMENYIKELKGESI